MRQCHGLAAPERGAPLIPFAFERRDLRADDIAVAITPLRNPHLRALALDGTLCCLGMPAMDFTPVLLTIGRRRLAGSSVCGTRETRDMLDVCAAHAVAADVEVIAAKHDAGFARLDRGDVRYRLVVDMATLKQGG